MCKEELAASNTRATAASRTSIGVASVAPSNRWTTPSIDPYRRFDPDLHCRNDGADVVRDLTRRAGQPFDVAGRIDPPQRTRHVSISCNSVAAKPGFCARRDNLSIETMVDYVAVIIGKYFDLSQVIISWVCY
jgi:DNA-binding transcriptional LysR family regulator